MDQQYGYVIRLDGTIPFDDDVSTIHRQGIVDAIKADGHDVYYDPEVNQHKVRNHNAHLGQP